MGDTASNVTLAKAPHKLLCEYSKAMFLAFGTSISRGHFYMYLRKGDMRPGFAVNDGDDCRRRDIGFLSESFISGFAGQVSTIEVFDLGFSEFC